MNKKMASEIFAHVQRMNGCDVPAKPRKPRKPGTSGKKRDPYPIIEKSPIALPPGVVGSVSLWIPLRVFSELNVREHWAKRNARKKTQQGIIFCELYPMKGLLPKPPVTVTLTRCGPRALDSDNLASAFKGCRDEIARFLKVDDGDAMKVQWVYNQMQLKGYAVRLHIEPMRLVTCSEEKASETRKEGE